MASSPLPSQGPERGRNCYVTPAFLGVPNAKRREKIRSGYLTPAFLGAQERAELLRNPGILGGPQKGDKQKHGARRAIAKRPLRGVLDKKNLVP